MNTSVSKVSSLPAVRADSADALLLAVIKTGNIELATQIIAMRDQERKTNALIAFNNAFADAKADIPVILKNRRVSFESAKAPNGMVEYDHEDLGGIAEVIDPILSRNGLTYRWELNDLEGGRFEVVCILAHRDGHFVQAKASAARDTSGAKNDIQGMSSSHTYLKRATLKAVVGIATGERDDDGRAAGNFPGDRKDAAPAPEGSITEAQADAITDLLEARGVSRTAFLQWAKQKRVIDIPAEHYDSCVAAINKFKPKA